MPFGDLAEEPSVFRSEPEIDADVVTLETQLAEYRKWLLDEDTTEVCINRPYEVWTEGPPGWSRHERPNLTFAKLKRLAKVVANRTDQKITNEDPILSATLHTGERVQVIMPPACEQGTVSITIRKPNRRRFSIADLEAQGVFHSTHVGATALTESERELIALRDAGDFSGFLQAAVKARKNIVISGATGSGKTTVMKSLIDEVPARERIITIEDAAELDTPNHPNCVHLFYSRGDQGVARVTVKQLLESCLRMKPDRIFLAELRGEEAFYYLRNVNSGHPGSITSIHANSARAALEQLMLLIKESGAGSGLGRQEILHLLHQLVDVVVQFEDRRMVELYYEPERRYE